MFSADDLNVLVTGCVQNKRESQKKIYEAFYSFGMAICERYTADKEEAHEILNDSFLKVFKEIYRYEPAYTNTIASFKGWIRKIIVYTAIDHYRKEKKHGIVTSLDPFGIATVYTTSSLMPDKIAYDEIIAMIRKLTPSYRAVLNLYIVEGFSHEEIASQLDISVGTSKSNLAKARKQLQKILFNENQIHLKKNAG